MMGHIRKLAFKLGINRTILYVIFSRAIQAFGGILSIFFISRYLSKVEQGYYYTFGSIQAIQILFELGLNGIIVQFAAHEVAHLSWNGHRLEGDIKNTSRLSSLLHFYFKWFSIISGVTFVILLGVGFYFFGEFGKNDHVNWQLPWALLALATALMFFIDPLLSYLEGLGKVKEVARTRLFQQISYTLTVFTVLMSGGKLFATGLGSLLSFFVIALITFFSPAWKTLKFIWYCKVRYWIIDYKNEIFPYQWRIAVSWISSYIIFQLFNPVIFATDGPIVAGQMGMTLTVLNGIMALSMSWLSTKVPLFSNLIATRNYGELDKVFGKTAKQASFITFMCLMIFIGAVSFLKMEQLPIGNRFLPMLPLILMCIAAFCNQLVSALAIYLRCHKKEPLLIQSVTLALLSTLSTLGLGHFFGVIGITVGYCCLVVFGGVGWVTFIFERKKRLWHA